MAGWIPSFEVDIENAFRGMRPRFFWLSGLMALALIVAVGVGSFVVFSNTVCQPGNDFTLRMNEVDCLRHGVDPYDVWNGSMTVAPYVSRSEAQEDGTIPNARHVYAYVPWEYACLLPFSFCQRITAWRVYMVIMFALGLVLYGVARRYGFSLMESTFPLLVVVYTLLSDLQVGNFGMLSLAAAVLMAFFLNKGRDVLAGVCWTFLMFKPQLGIVFAVPLFWRRRFLACAVAVCLCLSLSVIPSLLCGKSPVSLILSAPAANAEFFLGCGTWPYPLCGVLSSNVEISIGLVLGLVICLLMTGCLRGHKDWFVFMMPAAVCSCSWSYAHSYCYAMGWFVALALMHDLIRNPQSRILWVLTIVAVFSLSRWLLAWHGLFAFIGRPFPVSEYVFYCLESFNSTISLLVAFVYCVWLRCHSADGFVSWSK